MKEWFKEIQTEGSKEIAFCQYCSHYCLSSRKHRAYSDIALLVILFLIAYVFIGLVVGSILCVKFPKWIDRKKYIFILSGILCTGVLTILFSVNHSLLISLVLSALIGLFWKLENIPLQTIIQTSLPKDQLAIVYTSIGAITNWNIWFWLLVNGGIIRLHGSAECFCPFRRYFWSSILDCL